MIDDPVPAQVKQPAADRRGERRVTVAAYTVVTVVLMLMSACPFLAIQALLSGVGPHCAPNRVSAVRDDVAGLPDAIRDLPIRQARYVGYSWCYEVGTEGFVVLDPSAAEQLRTRYPWQPAAMTVANAPVSSSAPEAPAWLASPTWEQVYGHAGWRTILLDQHSDTLYFRDAYDTD